MKKRIISLATAVVSAVVSVVPFATNALYKYGEDYTVEYSHGRKLRELEEKYVVLYGREDQRLYIHGVEGGLLILEDKDINEIVYFNLAPDASKEQVDDCLEEVLGYTDGSYVPFEAYRREKYSLCFPVKQKETKKIMSALREKALISDADIYTHSRFVIEDYLPPVLSSYRKREISREEIEQFVCENKLDVDVVSDDNESYDALIKLVPRTDRSLETYLDIEMLVYEQLGLKPFRYGVDMIGSQIEHDVDVEIFDYVDGDANCDGKYTIADSTAILQHLGNEDKYGLSLQGEFNADIYNVGDGVTPMDALEVQKAMASKG